MTHLFRPLSRIASPPHLISVQRDGAFRKILSSAQSVIVLAMIASCAGQQTSTAPHAKHVHPAPGTSIVRFVQIDDGVFKGSKPRSDSDYEFLKSKGIKYIIDLKFLPLLYRLEKKK